MSKHRLVAVAMTALLAGAAIAVVPTTTAQAEVTTCEMTEDAKNYNIYAGHYKGMDAVPSKTRSTSAGLEAQCILRYVGSDPDLVIDGVFGPKSQKAMKAYQHMANVKWKAGLSEDGMPGPKSWPHLRAYFVHESQGVSPR